MKVPYAAQCFLLAVGCVVVKLKNVKKNGSNLKVATLGIT